MTVWPLVAGGVLALVVTLPLAWKWELGIRRVAAGVAALAVAAGGLVAVLDGAFGLAELVQAALACFFTVAAATGVLAYRFYRDPERVPPDGDVVLSPADGTVVYVRQSSEGVVPASTKGGRAYTLRELTRTKLRSEEAVIVGIAMSFLDVHVNRAPIAGRVTLQRHFSGLFGSLKLPEMVLENERATTVIERDDLQVAVVQIASRLVRQIVAFVREGEEVGLGQRIGVIRLGSQVDLVLPVRPDLQVVVRPGDRLRAGESVVALLEKSRVAAESPVARAGTA